MYRRDLKTLEWIATGAALFTSRHCIVLAAICVAALTSGAAHGQTRKPNAQASSVQPQVTADSRERCQSCTSSIKRRVAVMPVRMGTLSGEPGISSTDFALRLVDQIEAALRAQPNVIVVNRSDLGDLVAEQQLARSSIANKSLAPVASAVTPAELMLYLTVEHLDVTTSRKRNESSTAKTYYDQAAALERQAEEKRSELTELRSRLRAAQSNAESQKQMLRNQAAQIGATNSAMAGLANTLSAYGASGADKYANSIRTEIDETTAEANQLLSRARQLRSQAEREAQTNVAEVVNYNGSLGIVWRAVDSSTGAVAASGRVIKEDKTSDTLKSQTSAFSSSVESSTTKTSVVISSLIRQAVDTAVEGVEQGLEKTPYKAQIVTVQASGIILNGGLNRNIQVGDTFSIRKKGQALTDPATGEILGYDGIEVGTARVIEVSDKVSTAVVTRKNGAIARGDTLQWIGVYK